MLSHNDIKRGVQILFQGDPCEVMDSSFTYKGRGSSTVQAKIKNLKTGAVITHTFHAGDAVEEAVLERLRAIFIYSHRDTYTFAKADNRKERFELSQEQVGDKGKYLRSNENVEAVLYEGAIINIVLPVKVQIQVKEAPPGIKGDRAQGGTKSVVLETGASLDVPLFVESGDTVEVNTESGEYVRRIQK
ncbi:MAG: elongation factor P [archaeon]|nr:elongation factor P [archaeon]